MTICDEDQRDTVDPKAVDSLLGYQLRRAAAAAHASFARAMAGTGIREAELAVLLLIEASPGTRSADIGRALGIKRANMAPLLAELERRGFIERRVMPEDRRAQSLHLTSAASRALPDLRRRMAAHDAALLALLSPAEQEVMMTGLRRLWQEPETADRPD